MKQLLLAGAGHSHALLLRALQQQPWPGAQVTVVSPQPLAPYSGMVPGWMAGHYRFDEIVVDFPALCAAAGARWLQGEVGGVDTAGRRLLLADGRALDWDALSLNLGSTLQAPTLGPATTVLPLRPLAELHARLQALLDAYAADPKPGPLRVDAVGGGAAGFEALLGLLARLRTLRPGRAVQARLLARGPQLLPGLPGRAREAAQRALQAAGVELLLHTAWPDALQADGAASPPDVLLWAAGAQAHAWQRRPQPPGGLAVDEAGFLRVDPFLRSVSHPQVFAVGDCARWAGAQLPKAGVHAVRMAPVLVHNLRIALAGTSAPMQPYRPQRHFLMLLAMANGRAIAARGPLAAEGAWAWCLKDRIDRGFIRRLRAGQAPPA